MVRKISKYIAFTPEQKERAASVDLEEFLLRQGEKFIKSGREKRLASDHSVTVNGCEWFDHASNEGGCLRHAHLRSTNSFGKAFRLNVEASDPRYSFHHTGTDGRLYVFEAPIDLLSYISMHPDNWQAHS